LPIVLGFRGDLQGPWHSVHVWEAWPRTHRFCVLGTFSWAIVHNFGFPWWFIRNMIVYTFSRGMIKNSLFLGLCPFSWAIAHSFGILGWFTRSMTLSTCLRGMTKNSSFLRFRDVLVSYCPQFWGSVKIYKEYASLYIFERNDKKLIVFALWPFSWAFAHSFGVPMWFTRPMTHGIFLRGMNKKSSFFTF
jgi:hypothetical protein